MQQRRVRLGDIVDDYCPRERRVTNHAVVALIDDEVKQTRCTTCDADHEYKQAKVPAQRRRKTAGVLEKANESPGRPRPVAPVVEPEEHHPAEHLDAEYLEAAEQADMPMAFAGSEASALAESDAAVEEAAPPQSGDDEWPVHRRLIRATLPRPEGQLPERKAPDFTIQPNTGRFDGNRGGHRPRGQRPGRAQGSGHPQGQRMSGQRQGGGQGQGQRHGNRHGQPDGHRGGHAHGQPRGPHGSGRRRGR
jgi:hypothetical protein